jgi:hypothetical protein
MTWVALISPTSYAIITATIIGCGSANGGGHTSFGCGVLGLQTNAYIWYLRFNMSRGRSRRQLLSHYNFQKKIALAWIDPVTHWPDKDSSPKKRKRSSAKKSTRSSSEKPAAKRAPRVCDDSLHRFVGHFLCDSANPNTFHQKQ